MKKTINQQKGFTIIESLMAISILVAVVTGAMGAAQIGISSYTSSKNQITASYLAQEGFEQLRNLRDQNGLTASHWLAGIAQATSDPCDPSKVCTVSPFESTSMIACSGTCPYLRQDPLTGVYGYAPAWTETLFKREISLVALNADEILVTVTISWSKGMISRQFSARENIFNWQ